MHPWHLDSGVAYFHSWPMKCAWNVRMLKCWKEGPIMTKFKNPKCLTCTRICNLIHFRKRPTVHYLKIFLVVSRELHRHRELKQKKTLIGQVYWAVKFYKESSIEEDEACIGRSGIFDSRVSKKAGRAWTLTAEFGRKQVGHALLTAEFGRKQVSQVMRGLSAAICWWLLFAEGYIESSHLWTIFSTESFNSWLFPLVKMTASINDKRF